MHGLLIDYLISSAKKVAGARNPMHNQEDGIEEKGVTFMAKKKGVSSKTHTKKQLDDYANQHNPNNPAYKAMNQNNNAMQQNSKVSKKNAAKKQAKEWAKLEEECGIMYPTDWFCYSNPYDFD